MRTTSCRALTLDQSPEKIANMLVYFSAGAGDRAGDRSGEVGFNPLPESHISGNRAGLPCRSGQTIRQESDQMDLHGGGIHSSAVTTRCAMAPSTGTHSFSREASTLWLDSHSSTTVEIKTALEPRVRSSLLTGSTMDSQSAQSIIWWTNMAIWEEEFS